MGDVYTNPPQSRNEAILNSIVEGTEYTAPPQSRIEDLLLEVKEVIEEGGHDESATRASIAPTESDAAHASKRIEIGEQFYLSDDKLYKATAVITQGTAIVTTGAGQNCEVSESVTGQIKALDEKIDELHGHKIYGFHINATESDPDVKVTYLADAVDATPAHMDYDNDEFDYGTWGDAFFMPRRQGIA